MLIKRPAGFYFNWLSQQMECLIASFPKWEKKIKLSFFKVTTNLLNIMYNQEPMIFCCLETSKQCAFRCFDRNYKENTEHNFLLSVILYTPTRSLTASSNDSSSWVITYSESLVQIAVHSWQHCNACIGRTQDWISMGNHTPLCEPCCLVGP